LDALRGGRDVLSGSRGSPPPEQEERMELYFSPLACSLASRICLYEAEAEARFIEIDAKTRLTPEGTDYRTIHPLGLVPALRTPDGELLSENAAVLQYLADHFPQAKLAPTSGFERARLQQWLCFIGTELHKGLFTPLLDGKAPAEVKAYVLEKGRLRLDVLAQHLTGREHLLDPFSVADAYLVAILNWTMVIPQLDLRQWPALDAYCQRLRERPAIARALNEEMELYRQEQLRNAS
jgi:glutathione S-transferase